MWCENPSILHKLQRWVGDINSTVDISTSAIEILNTNTDIPANHGAIFTYSRDDIEVFDMGPGRVYEEGTMKEVPPNKPLSLAVPLNKFKEYQRKAQVLGLQFPVLPIEAVDYHFSQFPLPQLTSELKVAWEIKRKRIHV